MFGRRCFYCNNRYPAAVFVCLLFTAFAAPAQPANEPDLEIKSPNALRAVLQYQGRLLEPATGVPIEGPLNITFNLYDAADAPVPLWSETKELIITNGFFITLLGDITPFPEDFFRNEERWLGITVGTDPEAAPRQIIAPSPYALFALDAATLDGHTTSDFATAAHSHDNEYLSGAGPSVITAASSDPALQVTQNGAGVALRGEGQQGGVYGAAYAEDAKGVTGYAAGSGSAYGVHGIAAAAAQSGVYGKANAVTGNVYGVTGENVSTNGGAGMLGNSPFIGVRANSSGRYGVFSESYGDTGYGVYAMTYGDNSTGIYGGISGSGGYAGRFDGPVQIFGNLHVSGSISKSGGSFKIDHPLDPDNKYLSHSFVESPEMMNVYNGNIALDENGEAWVELPAWFEALNKDFRYQLTPIGAPAPELYVAEEVTENRFKIAGGMAGGRVSWQLTGIRQDPHAENNRVPIEEDKPEEERGLYLYPEAFGLGEEYSLVHKIKTKAQAGMPEPIPTR